MVQALQFSQQIVQQGAGIARMAHGVANLLLHHWRPCERAQVEADHRTFHPATRGIDIGCIFMLQIGGDERADGVVHVVR